jgi:hypothetical protein
VEKRWIAIHQSPLNFVAELIDRDSWSPGKVGHVTLGATAGALGWLLTPLMREARIQSHAQTSLPAVKITTHPMRNRKIETARSLCFLNSLNPSLIRVGRRKKIERMKRKIGTAAATKAMILKIIVHSF